MNLSLHARPVVFCLLLLAAYLLFANTFAAEWSHDDFPVIVDNPDVRSLGEFFKDSYPGRPLRELSFLVDYQFFGDRPMGYHIQHIFWHALNAFLLFLLALELGAARRVAWLVALLFLVHPLQVEVVANLSHRKDSLALAFCLLALLAWIRGRQADRFDLRWLAGAVLCGGLAMLAKQNAVVLPGIVFGYELLMRGGRAVWRPGHRLLPAALVALGGIGLWFVWARFVAGKNLTSSMLAMLASKTGLLEGFSVEIYYATVLKSWLFNWSRLFWPRHLAIEYHMPAATGFADPAVMLAMAVVVALLLGLMLCWRRLPLAAFGLGWFLLFWLPTANLIPQVYFAADRYMYTPLAGALLALVVLLDHLLRGRWSFRLLGAGLVLVLALLCWQQNRVWLTVESLWTQAVLVSPRSSFALNNLGNVFLLKGNLLKARDLYERSVTVDPNNPTAYYNLGMIYERVGMQERALEYYRRFLAIPHPHFTRAARELRLRLPTLAP